MRQLKQFFLFLRALMAAREVQDFLLGGPPGRTARNESWSVWIDTMQKRITKLHGISRTNGSWRVEVRKRLLQMAAISIAMIEWIDAGYGDEA